MPNAWDAGSAIVLAEAGFEAIATTSAGIAFSLGKADHAIPGGATPVSRSEMFERIRQIAAAVDVPVNGDLEAGYGDRPEAVAETIRLGIDAGLAGGNIEDYANGVLYDEELAAERIAAAREVIDAGGTGFVLTARTDGQLTLTVSALRSAGVARISLGGSIARAALGYVREGARELLERGTIGFAEVQIPQGELNALFARRASTTDDTPPGSGRKAAPG